MKKDAKYNMGDLVVDVVTGYQGVVMGIAYYATGCIHYGICPTKITERGEVPNWTWLDQSRLDLVKKDQVKFKKHEKTSEVFVNLPSSM